MLTNVFAPKQDRIATKQKNTKAIKEKKQQTFNI